MLICCLKQGCTNLPNIWEPPENFRCQITDMEQLPYWWPTIILHHCSECSHLDDLAPGIFAVLGKVFKWQMLNDFILPGVNYRTLHSYSHCLLHCEAWQCFMFDYTVEVMFQWYTQKYIHSVPFNSIRKK